MAKLLIVDDDQEICTYLKDFFTKRGCSVIISFDGEDGLASFKKHKPGIVLLDVKMPKLNGLEVLKAIKDIDKQALVVMFTVVGDDLTQKQAQELGADGFIKKPFNMEELEGTVGRMLFKSVS